MPTRLLLALLLGLSTMLLPNPVSAAATCLFAGITYTATIEGSGTIAGTPGNDVIVGADGRDVLDGGTANDTLYDDGGNDQLSGGTQDDVLSGCVGNDVPLGVDGTDKLAGGVGAGLLDGGDGNGDRLYGEEDNDALGGGAETGDSCSLGPGADVAYPYPSAAGCETTVGIPYADRMSRTARRPPPRPTARG